MTTTPLFTSLNGGASLPQTILREIARAQEFAADGAKVDLQIMCFAFTDSAIATALVALCRDCPNLTLRLIADWSQSAPGTPTMLEHLAAQGLRNLFIKFKLDLPYVSDGTKRLRYSYGASRGMLHHKTLLISVDSVPKSIVFGSYNWSSRGQRAYENLLLSDEPALLDIFASEFLALWTDHRLTGTKERAATIMARIKAESVLGKDLRDPKLITEILGAAQTLPGPVANARRVVDGDILVALSGSLPIGGAASAGHTPINDRRAINLLRPGGMRRPAPLTLNTLALEAIRSTPAGASLRVAMYALSPRVPEFGALIDAARRGVRVKLVLDGTIGYRSAAIIDAFAKREDLPLHVQTTRRRMHQKYLCCLETGMVLTGTANMTEDATARHSDHRILWRNSPTLAARFAADFDLMSTRLAQSTLLAA